MAGIFLSYAREDLAKARTLAKALERAGHSVWWDRQIFGGSEFSDEIEAALKEADAVVVLWSAAAIKSACAEMTSSSREFMRFRFPVRRRAAATIKNGAQV